jgi:hypothetical protein
MRLSTVALVIGGVVIVGAAGCTTKPTEPDDGATAQPPTTNATTAAALRDPVVGSASVPDDAGDGSTADIRHVRLTIEGSALTVVYELTSAPPTAGTAQLSVTAVSQHGDQIRQLGVKWIDGKPQVFVLDFVTSQQDNLAAASARQQGAVVTVAFPASAVAGLGETFEWHADSNVNGNDVDRAPDVGRAKFPELV